MIMLASIWEEKTFMLQLPSWAVAVIISAFGLVLALLGFIYNKQKDIATKAKEDGALMSEMKFIGRTIETMNMTMCSKFTETDVRIKSLEIESGKRVERLIPLEMKADAYGSKIDNHEGRIANHEVRITKLEGKEG